MEAQAETLNARMEELREEHGVEDGYFGDLDKINKATINGKLKMVNAELKAEKNNKHSQFTMHNSPLAEEVKFYETYLKLMDDETGVQANIKTAKADLEKNVIAKYPKLSIDEIKAVVVEKKWMHSMEQRICTEMDNISHRLTQRIKELAERYETPLPKLNNEVNGLTAKVDGHLKKMGFGV